VAAARSSFKLQFVHSGGVRERLTPATVVLDAPVDVATKRRSSAFATGESGRHFGPSRLREALIESMNPHRFAATQSVGVPTVEPRSVG
jgi:membrane carboxypeptidase/penicillin-binding protein